MDHGSQRSHSPLASARPQPRTVHRHLAVHRAHHRRATVLVAQGRPAAPTMSLARESSRDLFRNQLGLNRGRQRSALREGQGQIRKTTVPAFNHRQNALNVMAIIDPSSAHLASMINRMLCPGRPETDQPSPRSTGEAPKRQLSWWLSRLLHALDPAHVRVTRTGPAFIPILHKRVNFYNFAAYDRDLGLLFCP